MGNKFLIGVETSEQECCYDLLEHPITHLSIKVEFISTCSSDDRVFIAKDDTILHSMDPDSEHVKIARNIKRYVEYTSHLEHWCLADYLSKLDTTTKKTDTDENWEELLDHDSECSDNILQDEDTDSLFPVHWQNKHLYKCMEPKVIHFINYKYKLDPENYCRERLLLYTPRRCEERDLYHGKQTYIDACDLKRSVI